MKKVELSDFLNQNIVIDRHQCFDIFFVSKLHSIYEFALSKNEKIVYNNQDLLEYIEEQKQSILNAPSRNEVLEKVEKQDKKRFIFRSLYGTSIFLFVIGSHVFCKDYLIHEKSNVNNSYGLINELSYEDNEITSINTSDLKDINDYFDPTSDKYYKNTNLFYNLSDDLRVLDNISISKVLDNKGIDVIQIDNSLYSKTGNVTIVNYTDNEHIKTLVTSKTFTKDDEIIKLLCSEKKGRYLIINKEELPALKFEEIPSVYKNKNTGEVSVKNPSKVRKLTFEFINKHFN